MDYKDIELNDGGVIEAPDEAGTIRRRDQFGNLEDWVHVGDVDYDRLAQYFLGYEGHEEEEEMAEENIPDRDAFFSGDPEYKGHEGQPIA